jgi:hypothetical protein
MRCGVPAIDGLMADDPSVASLKQGDTGTPVEYLQDLLRGHGYSVLPDPRVPGYGSFGQLTQRSLSGYCQNHGLDANAGVTSAVLRDVITRRAEAATLSPAYLPLVLHQPFTSITRFIWLSSLFETRGEFCTLNLNTDRCGVSFGILQWAQRPGQLHTILEACATQAPGAFSAIMGEMEVLNYTARLNGGLNPAGWALDPAFELTKDPWKTKLLQLGADPAIQRVQLSVASSSYQTQLDRIEAWPGPAKSDRLQAFLLDLINQFGPGRVASEFEKLAGSSEAIIMQKLEDTFTALARPEFQAQVRARREFFRTTPLLSDAPLPSFPPTA